MPKRIKSPFYTETKTSLKSVYEDTRLPNGYLYSKGECISPGIDWLERK